MTLAMVQWLQGQADEAIACVEDNVRDALSVGHTLTLCNALIKSSCPLALLYGRTDLAQRYVELMLQHTSTPPLFMWHPICRCFEGLLRLAQGDLEGGRHAVRAALDELPQARFAFPQTWVSSVLALADAQAGAIAQGLRRSSRRSTRRVVTTSAGACPSCCACAEKCCSCAATRPRAALRVRRSSRRWCWRTRPVHPAGRGAPRRAWIACSVAPGARAPAARVSRLSAMRRAAQRLFTRLCTRARRCARRCRHARSTSRSCHARPNPRPDPPCRSADRRRCRRSTRRPARSAGRRGTARCRRADRRLRRRARLAGCCPFALDPRARAVVARRRGRDPARAAVRRARLRARPLQPG